jgi:hypothetical protein
MNSIIEFVNNSNLHAIISTSLIINLQRVYKIYLVVLEEIYNNVVPRWSSVLISCNHSITRLMSFTKKRFISEINSFCIWTQTERMNIRESFCPSLVWQQVLTAYIRIQEKGTVCILYI